MYRDTGIPKKAKGFYMEGATPQTMKARQQQLEQTLQTAKQQSNNAAEQRPSLLQEPKVTAKPSPAKASTKKSMADSWKSELGLVQSRPANPLETNLSDEELFKTLPAGVQQTIKAIAQSPSAGESQIENLRKYLHSVMIDGGNPFLVVKSYQKTLGGQIKKVLDQESMDYLDHYWEHWTAPPALQPPPVHASSTTETSTEAASSRPPPPPPTSDSPGPQYTFSMDPLSISPDRIPGVQQDGRGNMRGTHDTVQWIRLIIGIYQRNGEVQSVVKEFAQKMNRFFGEEIVTQAIIQADGDSKKELEFPPNQQLPFGIQRAGQADDEELRMLRRLMQNMAFSDLPGITIQGGKSEFSYETITWIQTTLSRMLLRGLNPDPFVRKLFDVCGEDNLCRAMTEDYVQWLKKELSQTKGAGGAFLEWLIAEVVSSPPKISGTAQDPKTLGSLPRTRARGQEGSTPKKGKYDYTDKPAFPGKPGSARPQPLQESIGQRFGQEPIGLRFGQEAARNGGAYGRESVGMGGPPRSLMEAPMQPPSIGDMMDRRRGLMDEGYGGAPRGGLMGGGMEEQQYGRGMNSRSLTGLDKPPMMDGPRSLMDMGMQRQFPSGLRSGMSSEITMGPPMGGPRSMGGGPPGLMQGRSQGPPGGFGGPRGGNMRGDLMGMARPGPKPLAKYDGPLFNTPGRFDRKRTATTRYKE